MGKTLVILCLSLDAILTGFWGCYIKSHGKTFLLFSLSPLCEVSFWWHINILVVTHLRWCLFVFHKMFLCNFGQNKGTARPDPAAKTQRLLLFLDFVSPTSDRPHLRQLLPKLESTWSDDDDAQGEGFVCVLSWRVTLSCKHQKASSAWEMN